MSKTRQRLLTSILLAGMGCSAALAQNTYYDSSQVKLNVIEFLWYYYYFVESRFADYPWVVRTAWQLLLLSATGTGSSLIYATWRNYERKRGVRYLIALLRRGKTHMEPLLLNEPRCDIEEMQEAIDKTQPKRRRKLKGWQRAQWVRYLVMQKQHNPERMNIHNLNLCTLVLDLAPFVEKRISTGPAASRKLWLRQLEYLNIPVPESTLVRQLNHSNLALRLYARAYYMRHSTNEPFRFMERTDLPYSIGLAMETHHIMTYRQQHGRELPDLHKLAARQKLPKIKQVLLDEAEQWTGEETFNPQSQMA